MKFSSLRTLLGERLGPYAKYYPGLDEFLGSRNASLVLCDLMGWRGKGKDPDGWIYKSNVELTLETGLSRDQQARAIKLLLKRGIIKKELRGIPAVNNFLVMEDPLQSQWFDWCRDNPQSVVAKSYNSVPDSPATITSLPDEATNIPTGADKYSNRKPIKSSARARMESGILAYKNRNQSEASGLMHISSIIPSGDNPTISGTS